MRLLITILSLCFYNFCIAQSSEVSLEVTNATIYKEGVTISRSGDIAVKRGVNKIDISDLPIDMDESTLNVYISEGHVIRSQKIIRNYVDPKKLVSSYDDEKQLIQDSIEFINTMMLVSKGEVSILNANIDLTGSDDKFSAEEVSLLRANYAKDMKAVQEDILNYKFQIRKLKKSLADLNKQIATEGSISSIGSATLHLEVHSESSGIAKAEVSYFHNDAGWTPTYDLHVSGMSKPLDLVYKANIFQNTGDDWKDVQLSLSTARPNYNYSLPSVGTYFLTYNNYYNQEYDDYRTGSVSGLIRGVVIDETGEPLIGANVLISGTSNGTVTDIDGSFQIYVPKDKERLVVSFTGYNSKDVYVNSSELRVRLDYAELLEEVVVSGYSAQDMNGYNLRGVVSGVNRNKKQESIPLSLIKSQTSINYDIAVPINLKSTKEQESILIRNEEVPVDYQYKVFPKIETNAYLTAGVKDWSALQVIEGIANIYIDNRFIGQTTIGEEREISDRYVLSLGQDRDVYVDRNLQKGYTKQKFVGNNRIDSRIWKLDIVNNKSEPVSLIIEDQYPVSKVSNIKVDLKESADAKVDKDNGSLIWNKEISPRSETTIVFEYEVKSPRDRSLVVE